MSLRKWANRQQITRVFKYVTYEVTAFDTAVDDKLSFTLTFPEYGKNSKRVFDAINNNCKGQHLQLLYYKPVKRIKMLYCMPIEDFIKRSELTNSIEEDVKDE